MSWSWIADVFSELPGCDDALFQRLWVQRRLICSAKQPDDIDEYSARLISATLRHGTSVFIALPDFQPHRPTLLFATALIRQWYDFYDFRAQQSSVSSISGRQRVLYFGSTIGIREQLEQVTIKGLDLSLAEVFPQQHLKTRTGKSVYQGAGADANLPEVVTIYEPADPVAIVERFKPQWLAIDCGYAARLLWLPPLLEHAAKRRLPLVAWGQNPLADCVAAFRQHDQVLVWPPRLHSLSNGRSSEQLWKSPETVFDPGFTTQICPLALEGAEIDDLQDLFRKAYRVLVPYTQHSLGRLAKDTLRLHWRYVRSLELLSVPVDFYEAEAAQFYGMKSFERLKQECSYFRSACQSIDPELAGALEEVNVLLDAILEQLTVSEPPLWRALCNLIVEETPSDEKAHLITFANHARKQLFSLALLARYNLAEEDLRTINIWIVSLNDLRKLMHEGNISTEIAEANEHADIGEIPHRHPLLVGLPGRFDTPKLLPMLLHRAVSILVYPHQTAALARQTHEWSQRLNPDIGNFVKVLSRLSGRSTAEELPRASPRIVVSDPIGLDAKTAKRAHYAKVKPFWQSEDFSDEVALLLQANDEILDDELAIVEQTQIDVGMVAEEKQKAWCERAIEVYFDQDWFALFAPDDKINLIVSNSKGQHTDERYVRSLKVGDRVIAIPNQRRQSLYELVISRVHRHPTIELHLALIRRWQQDFVKAYQRWRRQGERNLEELLRQMRERGSVLTSPFTLRQWLWGRILCPDDAEDLRRLAEVLNMEFVHSHYRRIHQAAKRIRGLHIGLSRRLNNWLEQQTTELIGKHDTDLIDPELGLTFGDFRSSLIVLRVVSVQEIAGVFLRDDLGKFERQMG